MDKRTLAALASNPQNPFDQNGHSSSPGYSDHFPSPAKNATPSWNSRPASLTQPPSPKPAPIARGPRRNSPSTDIIHHNLASPMIKSWMSFQLNQRSKRQTTMPTLTKPHPTMTRFLIRPALSLPNGISRSEEH